MSLSQIRIIFAAAALFELAIGLSVLVAGATVFEQAGLPAPGHWGLVQFAALMLVIFGLMFVAVAVHPTSQRNLIRYGLLEKLSCFGLIGYYWATSGASMPLKSFAVIDAVLYGLFLASYLKLGTATHA